MNKDFIYSLLIMIFVSGFTSCNKNRFDVDISGIEARVKIRRMEKDFFSSDNMETGKKHQEMMLQYGIFYKRYLENITGIGLVNDPAISYGLNAFLGDQYIREIYLDAEKKFSDNLEGECKELSEAFKYSKYYFPAMVVPEVVTFVSGFQYSVAVTDSVLGLGLDMYLGSDYKNYPKAGFPLYKIAQLKREFIVPDAMKSWLMTEFFSSENQNPKNLLDQMIQNGKVMYLLDAVLPKINDTLKIGFTLAQITWCQKNEFNIWAHLVDNQLLFNTDPTIINKFFNEAPFTSGLPKESPPKTGVWAGWQIVKSFMENNPDVSIPELIKIQNPQDILTKSKYKPRKG